MNCNTTHYRANSSSVPGDPTFNEIAETLNRLAAENSYDRFVLAVPPYSRDMLMNALEDEARVKIVGTIDQDLTAETEATLPMFVAEFMENPDVLAREEEDVFA